MRINKMFIKWMAVIGSGVSVFVPIACATTVKETKTTFKYEKVLRSEKMNVKEKQEFLVNGLKNIDFYTVKVQKMITKKEWKRLALIIEETFKINTKIDTSNLSGVIYLVDIINFLKKPELQTYRYKDDSETIDNVGGAKGELVRMISNLDTTTSLGKFLSNYEFIHEKGSNDFRKLASLKDPQGDIAKLTTYLEKWANSDEMEGYYSTKDKMWMPSINSYQMGTKSMWSGFPSKYHDDVESKKSDVKQTIFPTHDDLIKGVEDISDLETLVSFMQTANKYMGIINDWFLPEWNGDMPTRYYDGDITLDKPYGSDQFTNSFKTLNNLLDENNIDPYRMYTFQASHWYPYTFTFEAFLDSVKGTDGKFTVSNPKWATADTIDTSKDKPLYDKSPTVDKFLEIVKPLKRAVDAGVLDMNFMNKYKAGGQFPSFRVMGDVMNTHFDNYNHLKSFLSEQNTIKKLDETFDLFKIRGFNY